MTTRYIALDCESGGVTTDFTLLTVAFVALDEQLNELDSLHLKLKPVDGVYKVAAKKGNGIAINGIDLVKHDAEAVTLKDGYNQLKHFLDYHNPNGDIKLIPIGHNVKFDVDFLKAHLLNDSGLWTQYVSYRVLDTATIAQWLKLADKMPDSVSGSLQSILDHYELTDVKNDHTALGDARATVFAIKAMLWDT